jgi:branched-chain amino acid transport system substrate-binding protein
MVRSESRMSMTPSPIKPIKPNGAAHPGRHSTSLIALIALIAIMVSATLFGCAAKSTLRKGQLPSPQGEDAIILPSSEKNDAHVGVTDSEVLFGSCSALEGPAHYLGTQIVIGGRTYFNYVNDQGGVHGRQIKLIAKNDSYEPDKAVECFKELLKESVFAGCFFVGTPTAAKYVPMSETSKMPVVGLFTGAQLLHEPFRPHVISVRASYYDEAREQVDHLWNELSMKRIAVIYQNDAFGAAVLTGVKMALELHGSSPVALGSFERNTTDVDDAIQQVRGTSPDAVVLVGTYASCAEIVKRSHAARWNPLFTTVSFVGSEAFIKAAGKDAEGTVITQVVPPYNRDDLPTVALYKKLLKKYFRDERPNFVSFEGFVDAMVVVEGLKRAGRDLTRENFITALESIHDLDMGLGPHLKLNYNAKRHKGFESVYFTVVKNGQPVTVTDWKALKHG